jgi:hypothetical protein
VKLEILRNLLKITIRTLTPAREYSLQPLSRTFGCERGTPIDRFYIKKFIADYKHLFVGDCAEIGYPEFCSALEVPIEHITSLGLQSQNGFRSVYCNLESGILPDEKYDLIIVTQTFNFIRNYQAAIANSSRLLNEGGVMLGTVSGLSSVSTYDDSRWGDFYRFSSRAIGVAMSEVYDNVELKVFGNFYAAIHFLAGFAVEDLASVELLQEADQLFPLVIGFKVSRPKMLDNSPNRCSGNPQDKNLP